jgi:hypothetical protein
VGGGAAGRLGARGRRPPSSVPCDAPRHILAITFLAISHGAASTFSGTGRRVVFEPDSRDPRPEGTSNARKVRTVSDQQHGRGEGVKAMKIRLRHTLAGVGLAGVLVGGGAAVASAATSNSPSATTASSGSASAGTDGPSGSTATAPSGSSTFTPPEGSSTPPASPGSAAKVPPHGSSNCPHMGTGSSTGS